MARRTISAGTYYVGTMTYATGKPTVAVIANPTSDKGKGAKVDELVFDLLSQAGLRHGFDVIDLTGGSFDESLANAREHANAYTHLVVVGGDGMISLGANAVAHSGKPLGIVAIGSGNDFARGLNLPVNRVQTAVEGIAGAIVRQSHIDVDMGHVTSLPGNEETVDRYYAGMLSCGLDASINDRANHSRLPNGSVRYMAAVLVELTRMKRYGYHVKATLPDGSVQEDDIVTPLLTVANSRHIGGGIELSPYSRFSDGLLDMVWLDHTPNVAECAQAIRNAYNGRILGCRVFGWKRVRAVEITRAQDGAEPPLFMADGEVVGHQPVSIKASDRGLRVLVPPAVAQWHAGHTQQRVEQAIRRDGRDPQSGAFLD